jgi:hypothetical protein
MTTLTRLAYLTLVVGSAVPALAQPWLTPSPGVNFASGLICSYSPSPNYGLSTDAGDPFQLIDGIYNGRRWADIATVGWQHTDPVAE